MTPGPPQALSRRLQLGRRIRAAVVLVMLAGCPAPRLPPSAGARILVGVPFFPQEPSQCGPAALASLVNFFGHAATPERIAAEIYEPRLGGTSTVAMLAYGARHQLPLHVAAGSSDLLHAEIDAGRPLVVLHRRGFPYRDTHFVVVTGYDPVDGTLYGYSGRDAHARWTAADFACRWARAQYWALVWAGGERHAAPAVPHGRTGEEDQAEAGQGE